MTLWHCHIAVSLDGKIARPDGSVDDWLLADYPPEGLGFEDFYTSVDAILMGRGTYDALAAYDWPYAGKAVTVLSSRPLANPAPGVRVRADLGAAVAELEGEGHGLVWVEGGGQVIRGMIGLEKLDVLEMAVIPIILGDGIALFPPGTPEMKLTLEFARPWRKGAIHVKYRRVPAAA